MLRVCDICLAQIQHLLGLSRAWGVSHVRWLLERLLCFAALHQTGVWRVSVASMCSCASYSVQASRAATSLLHSAAAADVLSALGAHTPGTYVKSPSPSPPLSPSLQPLREANGLAQHHDAITGTAKLSVLNDYLHQLSVASNAVLDDLARNLMLMTRAPVAENVTAAQLSAFTGQVDLPRADDKNSAVLRPVIVYNSLLHQRNVLVVVRTTSSTLQPPPSPSVPPPTGLFMNANGEPIPCEAIPCFATPACPNPDGFLLHAQIDVPALGFSTVFINNTGSCDILQPQNASWIECATIF
jgi:hypothetical protein